MDLTALLEAAGVSPAVASLAMLAAGYVLTWVAAMLPRPAEGSPWAGPRRLLDLLAANVGRARNAAAPAAPPPRSSSTPGLVLALLLGGAALSACATTPGNQALQVETARSVQAVAEIALVTREDDLSAEARVMVAAALVTLQAAITAWDAAPADDARAQAAAAGIAALLAALREAGVVLARGAA